MDGNWVTIQEVYIVVRGLANWGCLAIQRTCALRNGQPGHDTGSQGRAYDTVARPMTRPAVGLRHDAMGARHDVSARCAHSLSAPCARPGSGGYALGAPSQFLDSVLFLSHCVDTVHEHGS